MEAVMMTAETQVMGAMLGLEVIFLVIGFLLFKLIKPFFRRR
jgi:hypothetical protein